MLGDGDAESRWDGFIYLSIAAAAVQLTKTDVPPEMKHLQAQRDELQSLCVRLVLPSSSVSLSLYLLASPLHPSHYHTTSFLLSLSLPLFLFLSRIDRLCLLNPSLPLSPSNGCSIGCGGWESHRGEGGREVG